MYLRHSLFSAVLILVIRALPVGAASPDEAFAAFLRGDYSVALPMLEQLAATGEPQAQYYLALMYDLGHAVPQDPPMAFKWYQAAATAGLPSAQFNLALMYDAGQGVPQDRIEALKWLELAASRGTSAQRSETLKVRDRVAAGMTADEIAEARRRASEGPGASQLQYRQPPKRNAPSTAKQ